MTEQTTAQVVFDCAIRNLNKRLSSPTAGLVERVLNEAGLDGIWTLKDSRRIRKKGRGKFSTIRVENRGGAKSIRIWCKPEGNDTSFEYSLSPSKDDEVEPAYRLLLRVHPVTLQIPESECLPGVFANRVLRTTPVNRLIRPVECVDVEEPQAFEDSATDSGEASATPLVPHSGALLEIDKDWELCSEEAVDRALMAISFVAEDGYARKADASAKIIEHLGIKDFCGGASDSYTSVEGSMRSITMALWKRKRYIERILGSSRSGRGASDSVRGYMITPKGEKRLEAVKNNFGAAATERMNPRWRRPITGVSQAQTSESVAVSSPWSLSALKGMVAAHNLAEEQIAELEGFVSAVDSDLEAIRLEATSLDEEIKRLDEKRRGLHERTLEKERERREWEEMKRIQEKERIRLEGLMGTKG